VLAGGASINVPFVEWCMPGSRWFRTPRTSARTVFDTAQPLIFLRVALT
jgi:hypothetical protein